MIRSAAIPFPLFLAVLIFLCSCRAAAQSGVPKEALNDQPGIIETKMGLVLYGIIGSDTDYFLNGKKVNEFRDLKSLIYPLHDAEASQLIRDAEDTDFAASMFFAGGTIAGVYIALAYKPMPFVGVDFIDRINTGLFAAQFLWAPSFVFGTISGVKKFNAVKRYNDLIKGRDNTGIDLKPRVFAARGGGGFGLECDF